MIAECLAAGLVRMVTVAEPYEPRSLAVTAELLGSFAPLIGAAAAHPHGASSYDAACEERLLSFLRTPGVRAVGEAGLDFHYAFSPPAEQERVFRRQIAIAREFGLPLIVHSRAAEERTLAILSEERFSLPVAFHCYTGSLQQARQILLDGHYVSISGIVTFPRAGEVREVAASVPVSRLFVETDSPYLAPVPHRGKTNSPAWLPLVHDRVAEIRAVSPQQLGRDLQENFARFFSLPCPPTSKA